MRRLVEDNRDRSSTSRFIQKVSPACVPSACRNATRPAVVEGRKSSPAARLIKKGYRWA